MSRGCGPIFLDEVRCTGIEDRLQDCQRVTDHDCKHCEDVAVRCTVTGTKTDD